MILLDFGTIKLEDILPRLQNSRDKIFIISQVTLNVEKLIKLEYNSCTYRSLQSNFQIDELNQEAAQKIYQRLLKDPRTYNILDRRFLPRSALQNMVHIWKLVHQSLAFIKDNNIRRFIILSNPHMIESWVLGVCFEHIRSSKVEFFNLNFAQWSVSLLRGLVEPEVVPLRIKGQNKVEPRWSEYIKIKRKSRDQAQPDYIQIGKHGKFKFPLFNLLSRRKHRLDIVFNSFICFLKYQSISSAEIPRKYIILFLHFQPERSTAPDGDIFVNQLMLISILQSALPVGTSLLVKEHPSTFELGSDWKHRWPGFYDDIARTGAKLVSMHFDPYELADNSLCTVSVGGTIGAEGVVRGVPTVYFGLGPLFPLEGKMILRYKNFQSLKEFLLKCSKHKKFSHDVDLTPFVEFQKEFTVAAEVLFNNKYSMEQNRLNAIARYIGLLLDEKEDD